MRTTLKRGIGRAGNLAANGRSAGPPPLGPVRRYRQPEPPRRSFLALALRGLGWFALAAVVLISGVAGGLYLYGHESLAAVAAHDTPTKNAAKHLSPIASPSQPAIALIAGYDHRAGTGTNSYAGSNSDTLMLIRADPANDTLSLLSLPRDLIVPIYCHGDVVATHDRINSAWAICGANGPAATVDTMEHLTGLKINYLITLDFHAFKQLVNRLHGVYMNVDRRYYIPPHTGTSAIDLQPGYQKLDGGQALSYVRFRHFDSDIYRTGRQQLFIEALKSRLRTSLSLANLPFELPKLINVLKGNLEVAKAGGGAPTFSELLSYLGLVYHLPPGHLFRDQIPLSELQPYPPPNGPELVTSPAAIAGAVHAFLHPPVSQPQQVGAQAVGRRHRRGPIRTQAPLPRSRVSVLVLNAGRVPGRAADTTYLLTRRGYATRTLPASVPANAPATSRATIVYYDPVQPNAKRAAEQLRPLFGSNARVEQMTTAIAGYAKQAGNPLTVVALGTSFGGRLVLPQRTKLPPPQPPQVSPGAALVAPQVRGLTPRLHFPVYVPGEIAQYSQLSTEEGVRVFKPLRNKPSLVLTFVLPNGIEYWQIEETDWTSAPILQNPTGRITYHGRTLLLYTTGGAIQMVVLRTPKASYWVINTILNQLSNSTMLAIAKSLRPLGR